MRGLTYLLDLYSRHFLTPEESVQLKMNFESLCVHIKGVQRILNNVSTEAQSVQFSRSVVSNSLQLHAARQASLSITNSWSSPKPMSTESVMPSNHLSL